MTYQAVPIIERKNLVFSCPDCEKEEFSIGHLYEMKADNFGPWYCGHCGSGWVGLLRGDSLSLKRTEKRARRVRVVLELRPQTEPLRFEFTEMRLKYGVDDEEDRDTAANFYEEHTCPTNWIRSVKTIYIGEDNDPHGIVELVEFEEVPT